MNKAFVISCEYATCAIPDAYRELFLAVKEHVTSPHGWDSGALNLAQFFATRLRTQLIHGNHTRLLIDLDRDGEDRWSEWSLHIPEATRARLADREDGAYRAMLADRIADELKRNEMVMQISVRTGDLAEGAVVVESFHQGGLGEVLAETWCARLGLEGVAATHQRSDGRSGLAAEMESRFPPMHYGFVRLHVAQSFFLAGRPMKWEAAKKTLIAALECAVEDTAGIMAAATAPAPATPPPVPEPETEPVVEEPEPEPGPPNLEDATGQGLLF